MALSGALLFYLLNVIVSDFYELRQIANNYNSFTSLKLVFNYFIGFPKTIEPYSAFIIFIIALLFGSYIALATFKTSQVQKIKDRSSFIGGVGVFLGFVTIGCAACGIGLASLLGLGGAFITLPFRGTEILVISLALLLYANWSVSKKITQITCDLRG